MQQPLISIIIPVYNVEKYIGECLDSIICQSLKEIEIICINDGSKDGSFAILQEYATKESRLAVLDVPNNGAGAARNLGLSRALGEYVIFFDSDDYMKCNALEELYNRAKLSNTDIVVARSERLTQETQQLTPIRNAIKSKLLGEKQTFNPEECPNDILQIFIGWPWDKLYRRSFLLANKLEYQNLRHSNDTYFVLLSITLANRISYLDDILFVHRHHTTSLANTRQKQPDCFYKALMALHNGIVDNGKYDLFKRSFIYYCVEFSAWHIFAVKNRQARVEMFRLFRQMSKELKINLFTIVYVIARSIFERIYIFS